MSAKNVVEAAKRLAARQAVDQQITPLLKTHAVVGIGSGSTVVYAVERLVEVIKESPNNLSGKIFCIPSSFQATQLITDASPHLVLSNLNTHPKIDVGIDGADEVDENMILIKGGGGCLTQEKIVAFCCKKFVIVADYRKKSQFLSEQWKRGIPIEVIPLALKPVQMFLEELVKGSDAKLRMAVAKAGPVVTDNGNFLVDWIGFEENCDMDQLHEKLVRVPGVVDSGIFSQGMADCAYFGMEDGSVSFRELKRK
jgi:ribose 5-phosphate isomerase A